MHDVSKDVVLGSVTGNAFLTTGKCVVRNPWVTTKKRVKVSEACEGAFLDLRPRFKKRRPLSGFHTGWRVSGLMRFYWSLY